MRYGYALALVCSRRSLASLSHHSLHIRVLCSVGDLVQSTRSGSRCGLYDTLVPRMGNKGDDIDLASLKESDAPRKSTLYLFMAVCLELNYRSGMLELSKCR